jgi:hypothetical protein
MPVSFIHFVTKNANDAIVTEINMTITMDDYE